MPVIVPDQGFGPERLRFTGLRIIYVTVDRIRMEETVQERNGSVPNAVVIGSGPAALRFIQKQNNKKRKRYQIIGFIGEANEDLGVPRLCGFESLAEYLSSTDADEVVIATESGQVYMTPDILSLCEKRGIRYSICSAEHFPGPLPFPDTSKGDVRARTSRKNRLNSTFCRFLKRTFDLLASILLILVLWPLMLVLAAGVRFTGKGTVLVRERMLGRRRKPFVMFKFRSTEEAPDDPPDQDASAEKTGEEETDGAFAQDASAEKTGEEETDGASAQDTSAENTEEEERERENGPVSPFRLWLRNTRLDLLPRLFNILTGAMSFIGPRPEPRAFIRKYRDTMPGFMLRYRMRPGLIGWARLINKRQEELIPEEEWIRYDLWYVANWSPRLDLSILKKSLFDRKTYSEGALERKRVEEARTKAEEARKTAEEARKTAIEEQKAVKDAISEKVRSKGEVALAVAGYFGRPLIMFLPVLVMFYYVCYRMDPVISVSMFVPLEAVSLVLFAVTSVLSIKKRTSIQIILFVNFLWMVFTRILHNDLTVTPHGVCYFTAMFFAFYACGILLKNQQREFFMDLVAVVIGGVLLLWGVIGFITALTGQPVRGFEMIRLLAEKTPALMTFISFYGTHRNISSTYFVIMMGIFIYQYVHHRTLFWKILAIVFVSIGYIMVAMQHSRSNYMAASIVLTVALGSMVLDKIAEKGWHVPMVLIPVAGALCVFVFVIGFYKCNVFMEVFGIKFREVWAVIADLTGLPKFNYVVKFTDPRNLSLEITTLNRRTDIWRNAIPVLKQHPEILSIGRPENLIMETINERVLWRKEPHMHNSLLQQLMVAGVPGALLYLTAFCLMLRNIYFSFRRTGLRETTGNRVLSGILLALFAYSILEPLLSPKIPLSSLLFCLIAGCLEGELRKNGAL